MKVTAKGQSVVEFVLVAPILFFIFFGVIQLFYLAFVSFAVQRATYSIAQQAASSATPTFFEPHFQIITALFPLEKLNNTTLVCALSSKCNIQEQNHRVNVTIQYPMPIWIPMIGKIFGQPLSNSDNVAFTIGNSLTSVLSNLGLSLPPLLSSSLPPSVVWFTFQADCLDENTVGVTS